MWAGQSLVLLPKDPAGGWLTSISSPAIKTTYFSCYRYFKLLDERMIETVADVPYCLIVKALQEFVSWVFCFPIRSS